jgi:hypothetical protein
MKHTPGPWAVFPHYCKDDPNSIYAQTWLIGLGQYDTIAEVRPGHDEFDGQNDANARLIAAAPELLEALEAIRDWDERCNPAGYAGLPDSTRAAMYAAIAKATGEA